MVKIPPGYKLIRDISDIQMAGKPNLMKDIGILKANRTVKVVFNKFKKDYPELFDKTQVRNFSKKTPDSILGSVRRAYKEGIDSTVSTWQINGLALREAYAPIRTTPIRERKIKELKIELKKAEEEIEEEEPEYFEIGEEPEYFEGLGRGRAHRLKSLDEQWIIKTALYEREDLYRYFGRLSSILGQDSLTFPELYVICEFNDTFGALFYRTIGKVPNTPSSLPIIKNGILDILNSISDGLYDEHGDKYTTYGSVGILGEPTTFYTLTGLETVFCAY